MSKRRGANKENLEETHRIFLQIAREEFTEHGYAAGSTSRIVEQSGMARGSLYYHFGDKQGLFKAVYIDMMETAVQDVVKAMDANTDPWDALMAGTQTYIDLCMDKAFRKITLIESQAALPIKDRYAIHERTLLEKLRSILPTLTEKRYFPGHTANSLSIFIFGILGEIGRAFDFSENIKADRETYGQAFTDTMQRMAQKN